MSFRRLIRCVTPLRGLLMLRDLLLIAVFAALATRAGAVEWAVNEWVGQVEIRSERPYDDRLRAAVQELGPLKKTLEETLGFKIRNRPIEVNVLGSRSSYARYVELRVAGGSSRAALFVTGVDRDRVYAVHSRNVDVDVRHECTHAFLNAELAYVPLWLDEGLAEYFEVSPSSRYAGHAHLKHLRRRSFLLWKPNLERLEAIGNLVDMGEEEYRESWAWVHFMLHGPEPARRTLRNYLASIAAGDYAGKLEPRLTAAVGNLEGAFRKHFRSVR